MSSFQLWGAIFNEHWGLSTVAKNKYELGTVQTYSKSANVPPETDLMFLRADLPGSFHTLLSEEYNGSLLM